MTSAKKILLTTKSKGIPNYSFDLTHNDEKMFRIWSQPVGPS